MNPASWYFTVVAIILSWANATAYSQDHRNLTIAETREASEVVDTAALPAKCGADGSVYVRFFNGYVMAPSKLSADAKKITTFSLDRTQYSQHSHIWDFAPADNGGVYELIFHRGGEESGYRLLAFDKDGSISHDVALDLPFEPTHIAVLGDRSFVIEGRKKTEQGGHAGSPAMAIVGENGQLLNALKLEGDLKLTASSEKTKSKHTDESEPREEREFNSAINLSTALTGDDGNVYVLRQSPTGPLFVISPGGSVRSINLPKRGDALIHTAVVSGGRVLLQYVSSESAGEDSARKKDLGTYVVYDLATTQKVVEYGTELDSPIRNSVPVCYNLNEISFLRVNAMRHPLLLIAKP